MRFKILLVVIVALIASFGFGQDINRAKEWHKKRAERPLAKVEKELVKNGAIAPKGRVPGALDEYGNPLDGKPDLSADDSSEAGSMSTPEDEKSISTQSDRLVTNEFDIAGSVVDLPEKEKTSPVLIGAIFLILGILIAVGIRVGTQKIKVPASL